MIRWDTYNISRLHCYTPRPLPDASTPLKYFQTILILCFQTWPVLSDLSIILPVFCVSSRPRYYASRPLLLPDHDIILPDHDILPPDLCVYLQTSMLCFQFSTTSRPQYYISRYLCYFRIMIYFKTTIWYFQTLLIPADLTVMLPVPCISHRLLYFWISPPLRIFMTFIASFFYCRILSLCCLRLPCAVFHMFHNPQTIFPPLSLLLLLQLCLCLILEICINVTVKCRIVT